MRLYRIFFMEQEQLQAFTARITQANKSELTVIVYEIIITDIDLAIGALEKDEFYLFEQQLKHGQRFLLELMNTLNFQYRISRELMSIYIYINKQLIVGMIGRKKEPLEEAYNLLNVLLLAFQEVSKQDHSAPLMENTQKVYAGLTYGKGILNETFINSPSRGFQA